MRRRLTALCTVLLLASFLSVAVPRTAHAAAGCRVTYSVTYSTAGLFGAALSVTNLGDPVTSWQLTWSFTAGQRITQGWYGVFSQTGDDVTVDNEFWNGALGTGETVAYIGFNGTQGETNPPPDSIAFNGTPCDLVLPTPTGPVPPQAPVGQVLDVDAAPSGFRPVRHAAAGGVHALRYPNHPADSSLRPLRLNRIVQPALASSPASASDPLLVSPQADRAGVAQYVRMSDALPGSQMPGPDMGQWLSRVDAMVTYRLNAYHVSNIAGWEIWNEPDLTWNPPTGVSFNEGWFSTYRQIRRHDQITPIVGPSLSHWNLAFMQSFLTYAKGLNVLPQVVSWHEAERAPSRIEANVRAYRELEASLGIGPLPISISGYGDGEEVHSPGRMATYIAKLERAGVSDAERTFRLDPGTLSGLVVDDDQPTGTWWLYKWYGDLAGTMVPTTPPGQTGLDGFAAYDRSRRLLHVVVGDQSGDNSVRIRHLDLGATVRVTVESAPANAGPAGPPTVLSDAQYQVVDGQLVVNIPNMHTLDAYRLTVQPVGGDTTFPIRYEAENANVVRATPIPSASASNGGYVGNITGYLDPRFGSYLDFVVEAPVGRVYVLRVRYANPTGTTAVQGYSINGETYRPLTYPATPPGVFGAIDVVMTLAAGHNVIRIAKCAATLSSLSPGCSTTAGSVSIDYIELT